MMLRPSIALLLAGRILRNRYTFLPLAGQGVQPGLFLPALPR